MSSGMMWLFEPFGVPALYVSAGRRLNITSTPPWRGSPGRGESKPSEITGARPFQRGTGQTQWPGSGPANGATGTPAVGVELDAACLPCRDHAYTAIPPPTIQGHARTSRLL